MAPPQLTAIVRSGNLVPRRNEVRGRAQGVGVFLLEPGLVGTLAPMLEGFMPSRSRTAFLVLFFLVLASSLASAQVWVATSNNDICEIIDGAAQNCVVDSGQKFEGIALREDATAPEIVAASSTQGGNLVVFDGGTKSVVASILFAKASGVATDPDGNIFANNANLSGADRVVLVRRRAGAEILIGVDDSVDVPPHNVQLLADVVYLQSPVNGFDTTVAGDLLLLVRRQPALLLRYAAADIFDLLDVDDDGTTMPPGTADPDFLTDDFDGAEPTGMAVAPDGTLYVVTHDQRILFYDENGDPVDFLQGDLLPGNGVRIDVSSFEEPVNEVTRTVTEVVVSVHQNGAVVFYQERDGAVTMSDIVTANVESPVGVAIEDGNTTAVSIGNQTVQLQALAVRFDVNQSGSIGSLCQTIEDSRDTSVPVESPLTTFLEVEVELPGSEPNDPPFRFRVPTFVRGFPQRASGDLDGGPFTGPEVLRVCLATADLGFTGLAHVDSNETGWLGYKPSCTAAAVETPNGTVYPMRPRFFYIREAPPFLFEQERTRIRTSSSI